MMRASSVKAWFENSTTIVIRNTGHSFSEIPYLQAPRSYQPCGPCAESVILPLEKCTYGRLSLMSTVVGKYRVSTLGYILTHG